MTTLLALVDDPDVQRLPARSFRLLVNLMGLAQAGPLPARSRLAWRLHLSDAALARDLAPLVVAGRVTVDGELIGLAGERGAAAPDAAGHTAASATETHPVDDSRAPPSCPADAAPSPGSDGSRERTRAWRARRRAAQGAQPRLPLFFTVAKQAGADAMAGSHAGRDAVTRHTVTGDAGDASHPVTASPHERNQRLASVTPGVTGVTPLHRESLSSKSSEEKTQTLAREGDAVTGGDASHRRRADHGSGRPTDIAAARTAYERFRSLYPKPPEADPSRPAEQEFLRLVLREGVDPERIIAALEPFKRRLARDHTEPRFVPNSARWLRERRFDDLLAGAEATAPSIPRGPADGDPWLGPVLARLTVDLGADVITSWFSRLTVLRRDADGVTLAAPSRIVAARIEEQYRDRLRAAVAATHGAVRVIICVAGDAPRHARAPP